VATTTSKRVSNPKGEVIAWCLREGLGNPEFRVSAKGAKHEPDFTCEVYLAEQLLGSGKSNTKKRAERIASEAALEWLERSQNEAEVPEEANETNDEAFEGPWPIFPEVLAASINTANTRVPTNLKGEAALSEVKQLSLKFYKDILESLGEVVELEDEA